MKKYLLLFLGLALFVSACSDNDDEPLEIVTVELNSEVNEFIWKGMNYWYLWQGDQAVLADNRFENTDAFYTYLNGFSTSESLFNSLVYQPDVVDDFSWYIPDVDEQLNSFRGISTSYGIGFPSSLIRVSPDSNDVVIYIAYVDAGSPAANAGLKRGDIIYKVHGVAMNTENAAIINKVFSQETISLGLANIVNGTLEPIDGDYNLVAETITSNPIHFYSVIEEGNKKIGYLVYNGFRNTFNGELNDVFTYFL